MATDVEAADVEAAELDGDEAIEIFEEDAFERAFDDVTSVEPSGVSYLPDSAFDNAHVRQGSETSSGGNSSVSLAAIEVQQKLKDELGLEVPDDLSAIIAKDLRTLFLEQAWVRNDLRLRSALLVALSSLNATLFPRGGVWEQGDVPMLRSLFLEELEKRSGLKSLAQTLRQKFLGHSR